MGTNFYLAGHRHDNDPAFRIGKRSAAGLYCWDCRQTLCKGGEYALHTHGVEMHKYCPTCLKDPIPEKESESSAGRELGWNNSTPAKKTGVRTCSSFSWAMQPIRFMELLSENVRANFVGDIIPGWRMNPLVEDEYGKLYTWREFLAVMDECPVHRFESVGSVFS